MYAAFVGVTAIMLVCPWYLYTHMPLVTFKPVCMDERQELQTNDIVLTTEQADNLAAVLAQYGEPYRRSGSNTVLITPELSRDQDLIWNYTTKSGI
ncbi:MAG: hypothetical protein AAGC44_11445 [Planctomycetota bacterium]